MAGKGPPPKPAAERVNRAEPKRGDFTTIYPPTGKVRNLPARGKGRGHWSPRTRRAWKAWWSDPASTQWTSGDVELVEHLADVFEEWVRDPGTAGRATEVRQLRDVLGLTPKGRQDRRWLVAPPAEVIELAEADTRTASERMADMAKRATSGKS